jgi:signal transduction histidine kinase
MMRLANRPVLALGAVLGLAAVVLMLAVLQYRLTGQVSQAAEQRLRETLDTSTSQFRQEFSRELLRICSGLQLDPAAPPSQIENSVLSRYGDWLSRAAYRDLLAGLYLWRIDGAAPRLLSMDMKSFHFIAVNWPARLQPLHAYLQRVSWALAGLSEREAYHYPWILHESSPALIQPLFQVSPGQGAPAPEAQHLGFLIAELNRPALQQECLPALVKRYFGAQDEADFLIAIRAAGAPHDVLYQSNPALSVMPSQADAVVNLLDPPGDRLSEHVGISLAPASTTSQWQVVVRHRAGSLGAAVALLRWRNLAVSFGLLLLLAGSMALIIVLTRRAQRLAGLQMEFVAGVSHELRTPLAVICSAGDNLAEGVVQRPEQTREYGGLIRAEGRRLARMVEQILHFTSGQVSGPAYEFKPVQVGAAIERALASAQPMLAEAGMLVVKEIAPDLPPAMGDAEALEQCLENLLSNTVKYASSGQWLAVRAWVAEGDSRTEVRISVEDRGVGIPPADLPHIFEPFYRGKAARQGQLRGVGLGLHLVRRMMEGMGGRVTVSSRPGRGSTFTLHLAVQPSDG